MRLTFTLALLLASMNAQSSHECGTDLIDSVFFNWCIDADSSSSNPDILIYLHGGGGSEHSWTQETENRRIQDEWAKMGVAAPTVISVSFGPTWLLTELSCDGKPALYPLFVNRILPALESRLEGRKGRRMLKGESMGGFNTAQLILKHGHLFERAVLVCPAIPVVGPYSPQEDIQQFRSRHKAYLNQEWFEFQKAWAAKEFPSRPAWERHNPLFLLRSLPKSLPRLHLSCGDKDEHGFFEGTKQFAELAKRQGHAVEWQPLKGGHCVADAKAIADFLSPR